MQMVNAEDWVCAARLCLRRVAAWRAPPNWSRSDWMEEMRAEADLASWRAFEECASGDLRWRFWCAYQHAVNACLQRYRQEWRYARHCAGCAEMCTSPSPYHDVRLALAILSPAEQRLLRGIFWERLTETDIAHEEGVSVQAISKRKKEALRRLRELLE